MASQLRRQRKSFTQLRCDLLEPRVTPAGIEVIDFEHGFTPYGMTGGPMTVSTNGELLLSNGPQQQSANWTKTRVDVRAFHTSFVFQQGDDDPETFWSKGDGFTFALAGSNYPFTGTAGGGLGYQGLTNSVAIKFDLVDNAGEGSNSVGVYTGGATPSMPGVSLDGSGINLHSGHVFRADIAYDGADLALTLTDIAVPDRTWTGHFAVDIPGALGASTGYVGFTAGTWDLFALQTIKSLTYNEDAPPAPASQPPVITSPAAVSSYSYGNDIPFFGPDISLTAQATDDGGPAGLTYTWTVDSAPAQAAPEITPSTNSSTPADAYIHLDRAGIYIFRLTVRDVEGQAATSLVRYVTAPPTITGTGMDVSPHVAIVPLGGTVQFDAILYDQFGQLMPNAEPVWQVFGPGTIDGSGRYTAPTDASGFTGATIRAGLFNARLSQIFPWKSVESQVNFVTPRPPADDVDFDGGFDAADLTQNGSAHVMDGRLRLTDSPYQSGSAFASAPVDVRGFTTSFRFQIGDVPRSIYGDGLTFILQNAGPTAVGVAGGGLGYEGVPQSVAIKFDLVDNAGEGSASIGVFTGGVTPTTPADTYTPGFYDSGIYRDNVRVFQADLSYSGGKLLLNLLDTRSGQQFSQTYTVDIPTAVGAPMAYAGFTAGTGELFAPIDILGWTYSPTTDTSGNAAPIIIEGPKADPYYVRGTSTELSALAADDGGETDLQYIWEVLSAPAGAGPVLFSDNATNTAKVTTATFARTGTYTFRLTVRDRANRDVDGNVTGGHLTMSDPIRVEVAQVLGEFVVTPAAPTVMSGAAVKIAFQQFDQFGDSPVGGIGAWGWSIDGPGYIDTGYFYNAPQDRTGPVTIRATNGTVTASATINVVDLAPASTAEFGMFEPEPRQIVNGSAARNSGVQLTTDDPDQSGSSFYATPLDVTGFVTRFRFRLGMPPVPPNPASGIAFVIQGVGPTVVGAPGTGLGYQGIDRSVAVTFDPVMNTIGLATNGTAAIATINLDGTGIELRNENILQADLFYDGATLAVTITDSGTGLSTTASFAADIPELVGGSSAFVGFTGATGPVVDRYEWQPIFEWRYVAVLPGSPNAPPTIIRSPRLVELGSYSLHRLAQFQVRAADDAGPFNLRTQWELVSAPPGAKPRFEHFEPVNGNYAEFDVLGDYTFRVTVTDAQGLSAVGYTTYTVTTLS